MVGKHRKYYFVFKSLTACFGTVVCNGTTYRKPAFFIFQELYQISVHIHLKPGFCFIEWFGSLLLVISLCFFSAQNEYDQRN